MNDTKNVYFESLKKDIKSNKVIYIIHLTLSLVLFVFAILFGSVASSIHGDDYYRMKYNCYSYYIQTAPLLNVNKDKAMKNKGLVYLYPLNDMVSDEDLAPSGSLLAMMDFPFALDEKDYLNEGIQLIKGNYPTNSDEVLISQAHYSYYTYKNQGDEKKAYSEICSKLRRLTHNLNYKVVGVYATEASRDVQVRKTHLESDFYDTTFLYSYTYLESTVFTIDKDSSESCFDRNTVYVTNKDDNKSLLTFGDYLSKEWDFKYFTYEDEGYAPLFIDEQGNDVMGKWYNQINSPLLFNIFMALIVIEQVAFFIFLYWKKKKFNGDMSLGLTCTTILEAALFFLSLLAVPIFNGILNKIILGSCSLTYIALDLRWAFVILIIIFVFYLAESIFLHTKKEMK